VELDLLLTILIAGLALVLSGLGGHLASTKPWHKWIFWGLGLLLFVLIVIQSFRNANAQKDFQAKLDQIEKNTKQPPQVVINPSTPGAFIQYENINVPHNAPLFILGRKIFLNIVFANRGSVPVSGPIQLPLCS